MSLRAPVPSQIHPESFWMRMVREQSLIFLPILTSHRICLTSLRLLIYFINPIIR